MFKSFSTNEMKSKFPFLSLRKNNNFIIEQSIRHNLFNENEKMSQLIIIMKFLLIIMKKKMILFFK